MSRGSTGQSPPCVGVRWKKSSPGTATPLRALLFSPLAVAHYCERFSGEPPLAHFPQVRICKKSLLSPHPHHKPLYRSPSTCLNYKWEKICDVNSCLETPGQGFNSPLILDPVHCAGAINAPDQHGPMGRLSVLRPTLFLGLLPDFQLQPQLKP